MFLLSSPILALAQEREFKKAEYNQWSIEINTGINKGVKPYSAGYYSSNPNKYFDFSEVKHFDLGSRYMFSNVFGLKGDVAFDQIQNQSGSGSLPFDTRQYRIGLQGVVNLSRVLKFEAFTNRVGLLTHAGIEMAYRTPKTGPNSGKTEKDGGIMIGVTPQFRLGNRVSLTGDFTVISNVRQHFTWDGQNSATDNNLSGLLYNASLGLTFYLGKKEVHADWWYEPEKMDFTDVSARKRIDGIETLMNDSDKDGVPDYLDNENNTPNGVAVDTKGRFVDVNKNGVPDEMERKTSINSLNLDSNNSNSFNLLKELVERRYVNLFFDVNSDIPNTGSTNNVYILIQYLQDVPDTKIILKGYSDRTGNEASNLDLSRRRAKNVYDIILASGIDPNRVSIQAFGNDETYDAKIKTGLDLARRVSIQVVKNH